jgi:hypothetical protein
MNQSDTEDWEFRGFEFKKGSFHYETSKPYRLWYEYLRLSPIYLLAHKQRTTKGGLTEEQIKLLPDDFDEVLKTYDAFGDVYKYPFRTWWVWHGVTLFGMAKTKPCAKPLAFVANGHETNIEACMHSLSTYIKGVNNPIGKSLQPSYMLMAVPLTGSREDILKAVSDIIDQSCLNAVTSPYSLNGERFHIDMLTKGLRLLYKRAEDPKIRLWSLGAKARISKTYEDLEGDEKINDKNAERTEKLAILTSAMFRNSVSIMENAARGKFPCNNEIKLKINYRHMWQCIRRRQESNLRYLNWVVESIRSKGIAPIGIYGDWQDDLKYFNIEYKPPAPAPNRNYKPYTLKNYIDEQLTIHPRKNVG